jgi:hypothetical protein
VRDYISILRCPPTLSPQKHRPSPTAPIFHAPHAPMPPANPEAIPSVNRGTRRVTFTDWYGGRVTFAGGLDG